MIKSSPIIKWPVIAMVIWIPDYSGDLKTGYSKTRHFGVWLIFSLLNLLLEKFNIEIWKRRKINFVNKNSLQKWSVKLVLKSPQKEAFIYQTLSIIKVRKDPMFSLYALFSILYIFSSFCFINLTVCFILTEIIIIGESISVRILWSFALDCRSFTTTWL